ncbi:MAG: phosphoglucosamine mutase [Thermoplasmata archaeon]
MGKDTGVPPRLFGTDGIRGIVGELITPSFASEVAAAIGQTIAPPGIALVAHDFRVTSPGLARILAGTLQMYGFDVREMGPMPTPCLQFNARALEARLGLMVTASHNPVTFNGIKMCGPDGLELAREIEEQIEAAVYYKRFPATPANAGGTVRAESGGVERYLASIARVAPTAAIRAHRFRVVLDCGNGTSAVTSPRLLRNLGIDLITLNANPDGTFPGHPSEPKEENLAQLMHAVPAAGADLGIAHDGDSDRVAFVDELGHYLPGEVTLALFAREVLRSAGPGVVVTSVMSTSSVADVVAEQGGELVVTRSGSLSVARAILDHGAVFGGEENGGYYWPAHQVARDGPASSVMMLGFLAQAGAPLSELTARLPRYTVVKQSVPCSSQWKPTLVHEVHDRLLDGALRIDTIDGVRAFYSDGWVLVRPSGTEPLIRILAESRNSERAEKLRDDAVAWVEEIRDRLEHAEPAADHASPLPAG